MKSLGSIMLEKLFFWNKKHDSLRTTDGQQKELEWNRKKNAKPYKIPPYPFKCDVKNYYNPKMEYYVLDPKENQKNKHIIYIHGGGYVNNIRLFHWKFLDELATLSGHEISIPLYPLLPDHTFEEAYSLMVEYYKSILDKYNPENITIIGDSAGGGLSLGLSIFFKENNLPQPKNVILISPWVDVTMTNPEINEISIEDPLLFPDVLMNIGELWAGVHNIKNYKVSPLYGDLNDIAPISIFTGTHDILYPDIKKLYDKLNKSTTPVYYFEFTGMDHIFPLLPIPEAKKAMQDILRLIE